MKEFRDVCMVHCILEQWICSEFCNYREVFDPSHYI